MAIQNGTDLVLKVQAAQGSADEFVILHSTSCTLDVAMDTIDISTKDSAGNREIIGGQRSFTLSADGLMDFTSKATSTDPDEIFTNLDNRTSVTFTFALDTAAGYKYTGSGFITSLSISGGVEDAPVFSVSIDGTGDLVQTAV